jgi:hypothetical protein
MFGSVLVLALLIYSVPRLAIELSVAAVALLGIIFSLLSWFLFILMVNYSGELSFLSELIRHSDVNKDLNIFHGSTTRRFEYFDSSISSIVEALPFGGVTNVTGSLPIPLVRNLGLLGAAAYFTLTVILKR